ncbi:hypothetical protein [Streptomyces litchfieldiae]|uniref:Lipoprotein n=1 Tax=Streptomyces litchfieldiae TaxID=3075543 RepID=A0ABU2N3D0_9ACTN|nr:hypothetical protein [Streptomyces sp. DSM 44938]MDT0347214.1 hypothetical protein [Streptomyces sp. DSM 44938]
MTGTRMSLVACALALAATAAGCGIRATDVPVDAGPAPTRAICDAASEDETPEPEGIEVYLLCGSHVESVERPVALPAQSDDRVAIAKALLAELQTDPERDEQAAGFTSEVPATLEVSGPTAGDPEPALRLSEGPNELTAVALVQIICTFANSEHLGGNGQTVMLGGPSAAPGSQPRMYACTTAVRTSPEAAPAPIGPP